MKIIGALTLAFYAILLLAFFQSGGSFDLARHGLYFSLPAVVGAMTFYATLMIYLKLHIRRGRMLVDAYNMFLFMFSTLIVPGVAATEPIFDSYLPHLAMLFSGVVVVVTGILFEIASPGTTNRAHEVQYSSDISKGTALTFLLFFLVLFVLSIFSDNMNRAGTFNTIYDFLFYDGAVEVGGVANYRTEIYHSWGIRQVIGNYAGGVFGTFFALILFSYFYNQHQRRRNLILLLAAIAIAAFPLIFAIGSGSRLLLLRTLLIYLVYGSLNVGVYIFSKKILMFAAFAFALLVLSTAVLGRGVQGSGASENLVVQTEKAIARLALGKGGSTMAVYEYYPANEPFENGIPILERLLGVDLDSEPSIAVKMFAYRTDGELGTAGPQSFGDFYASFGYIGQLIGAGILAIVLLYLRIQYRRNRYKNSVDRAMWAYLIVSLGYTGYSDVASFKAIGGVYILAVYVLIRFARTSRTRPKHHGGQLVDWKEDDLGAQRGKLARPMVDDHRSPLPTSHRLTFREPFHPN